MKVDFDLIYKAVFDLALRANCVLPNSVYQKLKNFKNISILILQNAYLAKKNMRPLCQDCGQVVIFLEIGQNVQFGSDKFLYDVINQAVKDCYTDNFFRKSVVNDPLLRVNTNTNTPVIIHTELIKGDEIHIMLGVKGAGSENMSQTKMFLPSNSFEDICDFIKQVAKEAGENSCPPMSLGVGVGGTIEKACLLAKKALFCGENLDIDIENVFETKILKYPTHIACLPVCVNTNCHSARHSSCKIVENAIIYDDCDYEIQEVSLDDDLIKISTNEIDKIKNTKKGDRIALSGTIYTARDMAHKKLCEMIKNNEKMPFELKNAVIFYAGPCPKKEGETIGPVGPTTSKRMDKFAPVLFQNGVLMAIGKGDRNIEDGIYFKMQGGVASYMQQCVKSSEIVAFEDFGPEAVFKLEVHDLPILRA